MRTSITIRRWSGIAGRILLLGAAAWLAKIAVLVADDGRHLDTGAAAWLMRLGLVCLLVGATGVPLWLARRGPAAVRVAAVLLSPVVLAASLVGLGTLASAAVGARGPAYLAEEAGIVAAAAVWLAIGSWLLRQVRRAPAADRLARMA
ncbi:MAG: hypothetical protein ACXW61_04505 [Gemmatirosa sp.]